MIEDETFEKAYLTYLDDDCESALEDSDRLSNDTGDDGHRLFYEALCYPRMGRSAEGAEALKSLEEELPDSWAESIALIHAQQGRPDEAFRWLEHGFELHRTRFLLVSDPSFDPLRDDPRWNLFLEKAGLAPEQLEAINFEVKLPD